MVISVMLISEKTKSLTVTKDPITDNDSAMVGMLMLMMVMVMMMMRATDLEVGLLLVGRLLDGGQLALGLVPRYARPLRVLDDRTLSTRAVGHTESLLFKLS
jgi:hypothetical protein